MVYCCIAEAPTASAAVIPNVKFVGVETTGATPLRVDPLRMSHGGRFVTLQFRGPVPPIAVKLCA
jgi:hypothetical protein